MAHVVCIGSGQAGASFAARLRAKGFEGEITMIGGEPDLPYQRPPLTKKYLTGQMERARLYLRPESFYAENAIKLRLGEEVSALDPAAKTIEVGAECLSYDIAMLTTGAQPRRLPGAIGGDLAGVFTVRGLGDVDAMMPYFKPGKRLVIIGGGYIGLEAAAVAAQAGLDVSVVEMAPRILQRVACEQTADYFRALHTAHGVKIIEGVGLDRLAGDKKVSAAQLSNGQVLDADFVIAGIGIAPDIRLAEAAGLTIDNGIAVDGLGQTSDRSIYAAGDCASFPHQGGRLRLESVPNAIDQAEAVADGIMGDGAPYVPKVWFWSDQYDLTLQIAGLNTGYDDVITRRDGERVSFWYFEGDKLLSVDAMKDARAYMMGKRWIEAGKSPNKAAIADASQELKTMSVT